MVLVGFVVWPLVALQLRVAWAVLLVVALQEAALALYVLALYVLVPLPWRSGLLRVRLLSVGWLAVVLVPSVLLQVLVAQLVVVDHLLVPLVLVGCLAKEQQAHLHLQNFTTDTQCKLVSDKQQLCHKAPVMTSMVEQRMEYREREENYA